MTYRWLDEPVVRELAPWDAGFGSPMARGGAWLCILQIEEGDESHERGMCFRTERKAEAFAALPHAARQVEFEHAINFARRHGLTRRR